MHLSDQPPLLHQPSVTNDVKFSTAFAANPPPLVPSTVISTAKNLCPKKMGSTVLQISPSKVLKYGQFVHLAEAEALDLLSREAPDVSVPRVYNAYMIGKVSYIVMDYVPGQTLSRCWNDLSAAERNSVIDQIRQYVESWRRIRGTYLGSIGGGPCMDSIFSHSFQPCQRSYGPYASRQAFNEGVVSALRNSRPNESQYNHELEQKILQTVGEAIIFTHGDLNQGNIILDDGKATVVDWGEAGYSIEEREFTEAKMKDGYCNDWDQCISDMVPDFTPQFKFWSDVVNEMRLFAGV